MPRSKKHADRKIVSSLILSVLVLVIVAGMFASSARMRQNNEPASEGRPITPAGSLVIDSTTRQRAVGSLPVDFVRSPDRTGPEGKGRYLVAVNSGYGIQFNAASNRGQQSLALIDLNASPAPVVIQNVYFPSPQSVNVGVVFSPVPDADSSYSLYVSGGFENKIWIFRFIAGSQTPITPASPGPNTEVKAPFIDVAGFSRSAPSPRYNRNQAPVYPAGLAISPDGNTLFVANNLGDSLGIITDVRGARRLERIDLFGHQGRENSEDELFIYPYGVVAIPPGPLSARDNTNLNLRSSTAKVYVSLWNDNAVAVLDLANNQRRVSYIPVGHHPTAMLWDGTRSRLYVVNSNADSVSMIDTRYDREVERINVRLSEDTLIGNSPEGLALDEDRTTLFVANAHSNSVAVIALSPTSLDNSGTYDRPAYFGRRADDRSKVKGFIPTGQYPSAVAFAAGRIFVGNGKGTGFENSSVVVNNSGRVPNAPNDRFPAGGGRSSGQGGEYSVALVAANISVVTMPEDPALARYTQQVMQNNGLIAAERKRLFPGASPIKHIIYIIKENRTYDQVFGDVERAGNGQQADGDARLAIFGAGSAAQRANGPGQNITPNHRALALRFGLFDRFFVNSEASPDGHNWSTAAFSTDYVDKAYRWDYSRRGRTYDYEGFNRLPDYDPLKDAPPLFGRSVVTDDVANFLRRFIPYLHGSRDIAEPESLYLWDAAVRAGLSYRNYGEFVATLSESDIKAIKINRAKTYPDLSETVSAFPTKKSLEGHHSKTFRNFDLNSPDALTVESYRAAKESAGRLDPTISSTNSEQKFRGVSRFGAWVDEFQTYVADLAAGRPDRLPNLSIMRFPNDHTAGVISGTPTPQFFVADNDYAVGRLVQAVSNSPYWKDTAIFIVEDDAQDGPDHVDAHRSVALVISAYNRPGVLVHEFHNTVSMIRTMELLLGLAPMNQLDGSAYPIDIFQAQADLRPYTAELPDVALDNLTTASARDAETAYWMKRTIEQNLSHADLADPLMLNQIVWFSVRGHIPMPEAARLPAFDAMRLGMLEEAAESETMASSERVGKGRREE
jgi:DNA-binding beta-propeller fold protein YncE